MKATLCEKESLVLEAVKTGRWDDELRGHAATCEACSEAALTAGFLHAMREEDFADVQVPHAGRVWWKAQLQARRAAAERAAQPVTIAQTAAFACVAAVFAGVCAWQWSTIHSWMGSFLNAWHMDAAPLQQFATNLWQTSATTIIAGAGAVLFFFALVAYLIRTEE